MGFLAIFPRFWLMKGKNRTILGFQQAPAAWGGNRTHRALQPQLALEFAYQVEGLEWGHVVDVGGFEFFLER